MQSGWKPPHSSNTAFLIEKFNPKTKSGSTSVGEEPSSIRLKVEQNRPPLHSDHRPSIQSGGAISKSGREGPPAIATLGSAKAFSRPSNQPDVRSTSSSRKVRISPLAS